MDPSAQPNTPASAGLPFSLRPWQAVVALGAVALPLLVAAGNPGAPAFYTAALLLWLAAAAVLLVGAIRLFRRGISLDTSWDLGIFLLIAALLLPALLSCFLPPAVRDELSHHLALPKRWLAGGSLAPEPAILVSYFPAWMEILYAGALALNAPWLAKLAHFLQGAMLLLVPAIFARPHARTVLALALLWLLTPAFYDVLPWAYSDLGPLAALLAAFLLWAVWADNEDHPAWPPLALASGLVGLALAMKYTALPAAAAFVLVTLLEVARRRLRGGGFRPYLHLTALLPLLLAPLPYFLRNFQATGNPVYPLLHTFFGGESVGSGIPVSGWAIRKMLYGEGPFAQILIPLRIFFTGRAGDIKTLDGALNPLWLCWPLLFLWTPPRERPTDRFLALAWGGVTLLTYLFASARARYYLPALAPLAVLFLRQAPRIEWNERRKNLAMGLVLLAAIFGFSHDLFSLFRSGVFPYFTRRQSAVQYLSAHVPEYPILQKANEILPQDAVIHPVLLGNRFYYIERDVVLDTGFFPDLIEAAVRQSNSEDELGRLLRARRITHILYPPAYLSPTLREKLEPAAYERAADFFTDRCREILKDGPFILCEVPDGA